MRDALERRLSEEVAGEERTGLDTIRFKKADQFCSREPGVLTDRDREAEP